jgi:hypothetical protein
MRKGFAIGSIALALGCGVAGAQTTYSPAAAAGPAAPAAALPSASAPVYSAPADHGASWGHDVDGSSGGGHLDAGLELLVIRPYWDSNPAATASTFTTTTTAPFSSTTTTEQVNFDYPYTANPRLWLGYVTDSGLGVRVTWFEFEQSSRTAVLGLPSAPAANSSSTVTAPNFGGTLGGLTSSASVTNFGGVVSGVPAAEAVGSNLRLQSWDFEATGSYRSGCFSAEGSAGVRYAHLSQNFAALGISNDVGGVVGSSTTSLALSGHNFNGAGPTLAVTLSQHLGDSGLGFYGMGRGAVLFGNKHGTAVSSSVTTDATGAVTTGPFNSQFHNDSLGTIGVGEAEIGLEFSRKMGEGASLFVRAGIDGQIWIGAGNATSETGNLGLFGYTFTVGVNY